MSWFKPGNIYKPQEQVRATYTNQNQEERIFRFSLKPGNSNEIIWLDDFTEEDQNGNKIVPFGFFYEHIYQEMSQDEHGEYTIKKGGFKFTTCRREHADKKGCPMCKADFSSTKSAFLTVLAKRISSKGNEYFSRQLYTVKSGNWESIQMMLNGSNLQYKKFLVKRKNERKSISSGEIFKNEGQFTKDDLLTWKEEDQPRLYGEVEPFNYQEIFCPLTHDEMKQKVDSGEFKLIYKMSDKAKSFDTSKKTLSIDDDEDKIPF